MAADTLVELLGTLTKSVDSAVQAAPEPTTLRPPAQELSLLTTKNELLLSYVYNLVFLILVKLRHTVEADKESGDGAELVELNQKVTEKLAELRLYLDKGIKPLEGRLKYQIDKVLRAAEENENGKRMSTKIPKPVKQQRDADISGSDASEQDSDAAYESSDDEADLAAAPNRAALMRRTNELTSARESTTTTSSTGTNKPAIYRPPRITPTALPTTTASRDAKAARRTAAPSRSAALDDFIANEYSSAPTAEPSIGSTIRAGGRHTLSQRERAVDADRRRYEEDNFVRLPAPSKKERAKLAKPARGGAAGGFGGEEWQNLGRGLERIDRLTQRGTGGASLLAKSRKRAVQDGPRDSGEQFGQKRHKSGRR